MIKKLGLLIGWGFISGLMLAQENTLPKLNIHWEDRGDSLIEQLILTTLKEPTPDSLVGKLRDHIFAEVRSRGYQEFELSKPVMEGNAKVLKAILGPLYRIKGLKWQGENPGPDEQDLAKWIEQEPPLDWVLLDKKLERLLVPYVNKGYPFAALTRESVEYKPFGVDTVGVYLRYRIEPGPLVKIASLRFSGDFPEKESFLHSLVQVFPGDVFQQRQIQLIRQRLENSLYFQHASQPRVQFPDSKSADIEVELSARQRGKVDAVLGILPPSEGNEKLNVTGLMQLELVGNLGLGEYVSLDYQSLQASSQQLALEVDFPFLLGKPIGVSGELDMVKREERFLNVQGKLGLLYFIQPNFTVELSYQNQNSRLLELEEVMGQAEDLLHADGDKQLLGLEIRYEKLDNRLNPSRGIITYIQAHKGTRNTNRNPEIPEEKYAELPLEQDVQEWDWGIHAYMPLGKRWVLATQYTGYLLDQERYFENDQRLLGGARSIRGFNENEFFADHYHQIRAELRLMLERASNIFIFGDYGHLRNQVSPQHSRVDAVGLGLGMRYETRAGILSLTYGLGQASAFGIPFEPARGKVHIGLVNQF